jgi:hypothetical protein
MKQDPTVHDLHYRSSVTTLISCWDNLYAVFLILDYKVTFHQHATQDNWCLDSNGTSIADEMKAILRGLSIHLQTPIEVSVIQHKYTASSHLYC